MSRPWRKEEIPLDAWFINVRHLGPYQDWYRVIHWWDGNGGTFVEFPCHEKGISVENLLLDWQYSVDNGTTWHICGVIK